MGLYFIAAGANSNRLCTLDKSYQVRDFEPFLCPADMDRLAQYFPSGQPVYLWGANEKSYSDLKKVQSGDFVVDLKNKAVAHVFRFAFMVDTEGDTRLQRHVRWDEGPRSTRYRRPYRYVYFLQTPRVPSNRDKQFFLNAFQKSNKPHFFDGQKYIDDGTISAAIRRVGVATLEEFLGLDPSASGEEPFGVQSVSYPARSVHEIASPPDWIIPIVEAVRNLKQASVTTERDHENVVARFFESLGYRSGREIRFQRANIDLCIVRDGDLNRPWFCGGWLV